MISKHPERSGIGMTSKRTRMRLIDRLKEEGIKDERVLQAILNTPRHLFVDEAISHRAYEDVALPIGFSQTISQPFIVAQMTELLLEGGGLNKVLEIGTGSGYQAAILAQVVKQVYSVERIRSLYLQAKERLNQLSLKNIALHYLDGFQGLPDDAPFDGILVTAAPATVPEALKSQLSENGGRLILPLGGEQDQKLIKITREGDNYEEQVLEAVRFVPLVAGRE